MLNLKINRGLLAATALVLCGCSDNDDSEVFESNGATESEGTASASASASASESNSASGPEGSTTDEASASAPASSSGAEVTSSSGGEASTTEDTSTPLLDVGSTDDGLGPCGCELAYIWIANADEGTVSKINVRTLEEEGRYITRPDGAGNPSRTSVNLAGDVAVANRHGGLVKIYADEADCADTNGVPGIQTSSGAGDVLPWDMEECRAWYTEFGPTNQRPVAWIAGAVTPGTCNSQNEMVWTAHSETPGIAPGTGGAGGVVAVLLDGDTGDIVDETLLADFDGSLLGAYGGAVNADGDLFMIPMGTVGFSRSLARVTADTMETTIWDLPADVSSYGITVDHNGRVWVSSTLGAGVGRFDPETETWDTVGSFVSLGGLAEGPNNHMWVATATGAVSVDIDTLMPGNIFFSNQTDGIKGISTDIDGFVWAVGDVAWKVDPSSGAVEDSYSGLSSAYTYSDMTGYALGNVACPPEG